MDEPRPVLIEKWSNENDQILLSYYRDSYEVSHLTKDKGSIIFKLKQSNNFDNIKRAYGDFDGWVRISRGSM